MHRFFAFCALSLICFYTNAVAVNTLTPERIDAIAAETIEKLGIPGLAIAVMQPGTQPHMRGYGLQSLDQKQKVTDETLFGIGSISKAFTATALAQLVAAGKLSWDDRVIDHIAKFRMADPWVTREFRVQDLLTHRSGLEPYAGDLVILTEGKANRDQVYQALANLPAASSFRSEFAYDNLLYIVAGDLIELLSSDKWGDYIDSQILSPLGMFGCVPGFEEIPGSAQLASAHEFADNKLQVVNFPLPPVVQAAGGIYCNARGMAKWLAFNLGLSGADNATSVVLAGEGLTELRQPITPMPVPDHAKKYGGSSLSAYGLGWVLQDSYGTLQVQHGGGLPGMVSHLSFFPKAGLGVVVMTNRTSEAARAVTQQIAEDFFAKTPRDVIAEHADLIAPQHVNSISGEAAADEPVNASSARPALPASQYAGEYRDDWFGEVKVVFKDARLTIDLGSTDLTGVLEHVDGDRFIARWSNRGLAADAYVNFQQNPEGGIRGATMNAVSSRTDPSYNFHDLVLIRMQN